MHPEDDIQPLRLLNNGNLLVNWAEGMMCCACTQTHQHKERPTEGSDSMKGNIHSSVTLLGTPAQFLVTVVLHNYLNQKLYVSESFDGIVIFFI